MRPKTPAGRERTGPGDFDDEDEDEDGPEGNYFASVRTNRSMRSSPFSIFAMLVA
jgi:hypothetical protein